MDPPWKSYFKDTATGLQLGIYEGGCKRCKVVLAVNKKGEKVNLKPLTRLLLPCKRSMVGAKGFEPSTSYTPCKRANRTAPRPDGLTTGIIALFGEFRKAHFFQPMP